MSDRVGTFENRFSRIGAQSYNPDKKLLEILLIIQLDMSYFLTVPAWFSTSVSIVFLFWCMCPYIGSYVNDKNV